MTTLSERAVGADGRHELPEGWHRVHLGEVCRVVTGGTPPRDQPRFFGGDIPWIKPEDLDRSVFVGSSAEYLTTEGGQAARLLPAGAVLVSCIGNLGKCAIASRPLATNQQINSLIPGGQIDSVFLYYACRQLKPRLEKMASTALVPIVNKSRFSDLDIPLPPLPEQQHIAALLTQKMGAMDAARAAAEAQLAAADALVTAYLRESLRAPSSRCVRLGSCAKEVSKGVGQDWKQYPVIGATRGGLAPAKEKVGKAPERYKLVDEGTIFYNPMRILIGSIAFVDSGGEAGITSPDYVVFKTDAEILNGRWFYFWLRSPYGESFIKTMARGAVRERMLFRRLADAEIEVPPIAVQRQAAERFFHIKRLRDKLSDELASINQMPAALLREAFSGRM